LETAVKKLYEGLFLIDSAQAASDWDGINALIKNILEKNDAEIVSMRKWDERKLAYDINRKSRGTYILVYFKAPGGSVRIIEREIRLSERVLRLLILNTEAMSKEDIEKDTPVMLVEKQSRQPIVEEPAEQDVEMPEKPVIDGIEEFAVEDGNINETEQGEEDKI
jgi:small subunit ribosomal protein S6